MGSISREQIPEALESLPRQEWLDPDGRGTPAFVEKRRRWMLVTCDGTRIRFYLMPSMSSAKCDAGSSSETELWPCRFVASHSSVALPAYLWVPFLALSA